LAKVALVLKSKPNTICGFLVIQQFFKAIFHYFWRLSILYQDLLCIEYYWCCWPFVFLLPYFLHVLKAEVQHVLRMIQTTGQEENN